MSFTLLPGEVTHPLTTWVDCGVEEAERARVGITGGAAPTRYAGRVFANPVVHEVEVSNLTPGPAVPAAAAVLLGAVLAGLGAVRRRRVATSSSLVLAGVLAVPAAGSAEYWPRRPGRPTVRPFRPLNHGNRKTSKASRNARAPTQNWSDQMTVRKRRNDTNGLDAEVNDAPDRDDERSRSPCPASSGSGR